MRSEAAEMISLPRLIMGSYTLLDRVPQLYDGVEIMKLR